MIQLSKTIIRRLGHRGPVAEIGPHGIALRAHGCRKRHTVTWAQIASLANYDSNHPLLAYAEHQAGFPLLQCLHRKDKPCPAENQV